MQFRWPVLYLTSHLHPVSRLRTHISITRKCGEMRTWEQERVYRDVPVWIWNQLENSFSKESGYRFFFVKQREFFINFTATTHVVGPFSHLLYTTTFRRMEIFFPQLQSERKDYLLDSLGRANFKYNYCSIPSSSICKWSSPLHPLLKKWRCSQLQNGGRKSMLETLFIRVFLLLDTGDKLAVDKCLPSITITKIFVSVT